MLRRHLDRLLRHALGMFMAVLDIQIVVTSLPAITRRSKSRPTG